MFGWLKAQKNQRRVADQLYAKIVAQARRPGFYEDLGVADTLEGRYEMVVAHLVLIIERLRAEPDKDQKLARALVELFVADMDDSMRELGIGDTSVPKKVKSAAAGLVERNADYRAGLQGDPESLARMLRGHLNEGKTTTDDAIPSDTDKTIAKYLHASAKNLAGQSLDDMLATNTLFAPLDLPQHQ